MGAVSTFFGNVRVILRGLLTRPPEADDPGCISHLVENLARSHPEDIALLCEDEIVTWRELNERANRAAHFLKARGITKGDCISIFMQNRIEFVVILLGAAKLGAINGLINTNLTHKPLIHCINLIESKKCVFGEELIEPLSEIRHDLNLHEAEDYLLVRDPGLGDPQERPIPDWAKEMDSHDISLPATNLPETEQVRMGDKVFYVFTSGTTGLPKAANVSAQRILPNTKTVAKSLLRITREDRVYNCLPLYHSTGLIIGLISAFQAGASTVIKRKLSVSAFWDDIRKYQCTAFVYIGEFIRYLMSRPPQNNDDQNPVRTIVGNGLRPDIWHEFQQRFNIERIGEFYGASEGNSGFANVFNKPCTVGLGLAPVKIVKYDVAEDRILFDDAGHCIAVEDGEPGLLLVKITKGAAFEGYTNPEASQSKVIRNVEQPGDAYFNTGDLLKTVDVGFAFGQKHYQFVDRVGDTFRWKSENVSTNEVAEIINAHPDIIFSNVYGVEIPGADGRAGMAAVVFREGINPDDVDLVSISDHIRTNLPSYARPLFIRVLEELPATTTHKLQKNALQEQAYHLEKVEDELLVMKPGSDCYCRLDTDFYDQIIARQVAF